MSVSPVSSASLGVDLSAAVSPRAPRTHAWPLILLLAVWARFAGSLFSGPGHLYLIDTGLIDVPFRINAARMIRAGHFPFWTSILECGFPQFADGQTGILYPFFAIYLIWPTPAGNDLFMAVHFLIAGLTMYAFLARRGLSPWAAVLGGACYFGGPTMLATHVIPGIIATLCWLPLALLYLDRDEQGSRRAIWYCALVNTLIFLAGCPNSALMCFLIELAYLAKITWRRGAMAYVRGGLIIFALPVLISAIQLLPTYHYFRQSHRGVEIPWEAVTFNCVFTARDFFTMGVSRAVDVPTSWPLYAAIGSLALAPLLRRRARTDVWFWFLLGTFGVLVATGSPLLPLIYHLPVIKWFRWPMLYVLLFYVAFNVLIAHGASASIAWLNDRMSSRSRLATTIQIIAIALAAWLATWTTIWACKSHGDYYALGSREIIAAARQPGHFRLLPLMHGAIEGREPDSPQQFWTVRRMEKSALALSPNYSAIHEVPVAVLKNQLDAVTPRQLTEAVFSQAPPSINVLRLAAITHLSDIVPLPPHLQDQTELLAEQPAYFYRLKSPLPRAWFVHQARRIDDPAQRLARLNAADFDPAREAIVEQDVPLDETPIDQPAPRVTLTESTPDALRIHVETTATGLLVVADRFAPEIEVAVDGKPATLLRVNHAFRGVVVSSGVHRVEMRYVPRAFYQGAIVSCLGAVLFVAGYFRSTRESA